MSCMYIGAQFAQRQVSDSGSCRFDRLAIGEFAIQIIIKSTILKESESGVEYCGIIFISKMAPGECAWL